MVFLLAVILDTNFFLSLTHPNDPYAHKGKKILEDLADGSFGLLYTTNYVISETCTLVAVRTKNNENAFDHLENLFWGDKKIAIELWVNQELENETWKHFKKINNGKRFKSGILSFVDVNLIIMAQNHNIDTIVSFDKHFDVFLNRLS